MVLFHLYTGAFGAFPDIIQRALHVGGTLILAFCLYDIRRRDARLRPLSLLDLIFITGTVVVIGHLILSYDRMMGFTFRMTQTDFVMAIIATALVLEGCRRVIGMTIPALGIAGLVYAPRRPASARCDRPSRARTAARRGSPVHVDPGPVRHGHRHFRNRDRHIRGFSARSSCARAGGRPSWISLSSSGGRTTGGGAKVADHRQRDVRQCLRFGGGQCRDHGCFHDPPDETPRLSPHLRGRRRGRRLDRRPGHAADHGSRRLHHGRTPGHPLPHHHDRRDHSGAPVFHRLPCRNPFRIETPRL